jgi:peptide/nickel transport system substrate-binding protein
MAQQRLSGFPHRRGRRGLVTTATIALVAAACSGTPSGGDEEQTELVRSIDDVSGLREVEPFTLMTKTAADDPRRFEEARLIVEAWQAAGIPVSLDPVSESELNRRAWEGKDYDAYLIAYDPTLERLDPDDFLARFWSGNNGADGSNVSGYDNPQYDKLYLGQLRAENEAERVRLARAAERLLYDDQPVAPYVHQETGGAFNSGDWSNEAVALGNPIYHIWNSLGLQPTGDRTTLAVGVTSEVQTLNPVTAAETESTVPLSHIYDTLVRIGPQGEPVNWAARKIEVTGKTVRVTLRDGMTFRDGQPVTADDVAFTINYMLDNESPLYAAKLDGVQSTAVNGNQITITLDAPSASFVPTALATMPILPQHIWSKFDDPATFANSHPIGSGPFEFESRQLGSALELRPNPDHFHAPKADGIVWVTFGSLDAEIGALEQSEIDILGDFVSSSQIDSLKDVDGVTVVDEISHGWNGIHFNMREEPFNDLHFRRALAELIPVDDIQEIVLAGGGKPAGSVLAPNLDWHDPKLGPFPRGIDLARAELEKAGYVVGPDGTLYYPPDGQDDRVLQSSGS